MPRSFDMAADYAGSVEQVHRAFGEEQYWLDRLADSGADLATLDSMEIDAHGGIDVTTTQVLRADRLPGLVSQFHRGDVSIQREETWSPIREDRATGTVTGSISGAPLTLTGTAVLRPADAGDGSRLEFTASVEVRVPLVGGKIEDFIGNQLVGLLIAEQRFTTAWLTENA